MPRQHATTEAREATRTNEGVPKVWPRQPFLGLFLAAAAGIVEADWLPLPVPALVALFLVLGAALLFRPSSKCTYMLVSVLFAGMHHLHCYAGAGEEKPTVIEAEGVVLEEPRLQSRGRCQFPLKTSKSSGILHCGDRALISWKGKAPACADTVRLVGSAMAVPPPRNPGEFDFRRHLQRQNIHTKIEVRHEKDAQVLTRAPGAHPLALAARSRTWMQKILETDLENQPEIAALISSMVLGADNQTPREIVELFQKTGTLHLFAVSGLNVGMFAVILWMLLKPFGMRKARAAPLLATTLFLYALLTGLTASGLRAAIMGTLVLGGLWLDRKPLPFNILCAAAFLMLAANTNELFTPGFQLSFAVVAAILLLAGPIQAKIEKHLCPDPFLPVKLQSRRHKLMGRLGAQFSALVAVSSASWVGSLPFTLYHFHMLSPVAVATNLAVVPLAFVVLALAMLALGFAFVPGCSVLFNNANWLVAQAILQFVGWSALLPGSCLYFGAPRIDGSVAELIVFDLGKGGAAFLSTPGGQWLLDCGRNMDFERVIAPALHREGVTTLDGLLLTHGDASHVGGASGAMRTFSPSLVCTSPLADRSSVRRNFEEELAKSTIPKTFLRAGDHWGAMRVLYPPPSFNARTGDDQALVVQWVLAGTRVLFMSDSGFQTEQWLLTNHVELQSELLVRGQHASDALTQDFLMKVNPLLIISAVDPFRPDQDAGQEGPWTELRQDQTGAVLVSFKKHGFEAHPFLQPRKTYTFTKRAR